MDNILAAIKCAHCQKQLKSPVLLPCGISICKEHTENKYVCDIYNCNECGNKHEIPKGGFPSNVALGLIIDSQISELDLGEIHKEAKSSCNKLSEKIRELESLLKNPENLICEEIGELKRRVDLKREELKLAVDQEANKLIEWLDDFQEKKKKNLQMQNYKTYKENLENTIASSKSKLEEWFKELKKLKINENEWKIIKQASDSLNHDISSQLLVLKKDFLLNAYDEGVNLTSQFEMIKIKEIETR